MVWENEKQDKKRGRKLSSERRTRNRITPSKTQKMTRRKEEKKEVTTMIV